MNFKNIFRLNFNLGFLTSTLLLCRISSLYFSISKFQGKQKSSKFEAKLWIQYSFSIYYTFDSTIFSDLFDDRYSSISNYFIMLRSILKIPSNFRHSDHSFTFDRTARLIIDKFTCRHRGFFPGPPNDFERWNWHDIIIIDGEIRNPSRDLRARSARISERDDATDLFNWFNSGGPSWRGWKPSDRVKRHSSRGPRVPSNDRALIFVPRRIATHRPQFMPLHQRNPFFSPFPPWFSSAGIMYTCFL